jgi:hypothetical protein
MLTASGLLDDESRSSQVLYRLVDRRTVRYPRVNSKFEIVACCMEDKVEKDRWQGR